MNKLLKGIAVACLVGAMSSGTYAGETRDALGGYSGPMLPYDFSLCDKNVAWADSLQPVFISYTARHGARYLTTFKKFKAAAVAVERAEKAGMLTEQGERVLGYSKMIQKYTDGKWGLLSEEGVREEELLGTDMAKMFPKLFKKGKVEAISTAIPRVVMTMYQCLHSLEIPNQNLEMYANSGKQYDSILRGFSYNKAYSDFREAGSWKPIEKQFAKKYVSTAPAKKLFKKGFIKDDTELRDITMAMYSMIQGSAACGYEIDRKALLTDKEYYGCWVYVNLRHYFMNSLNPLSSAAGTATLPLLKKIIADMDNAAAEATGEIYPEVRMKGNYGHAETLLPLLSLMHLPGCYFMSTDYEKLAKDWIVQEITPLGANLMVVLLRAPSGEMYASLRLNGKNIEGIPNGGMTIKWSDLKQHWLQIARKYE